MAGLLDDLLLQADDSENEEGSADDDLDLEVEVVEADTRDAQEVEEPAELGGLLMAVGFGSGQRGRQGQNKAHQMIIKLDKVNVRVALMV